MKKNPYPVYRRSHREPAVNTLYKSAAKALPWITAFLLTFALPAALCRNGAPGLPVPAALTVSAAETAPVDEDADSRLWSEEYYRAVDTTGGLSEAEIESLDAACLEFMQTYKADLSLLAVKSADYEGATLTEMAEGYYADCGFGYGEGHDGFQMIWDTETGDVVLEAFGAAKAMVPESFRIYITENVTKFEEEYGHFGPMYSAARYLTNYLRGHGDDEEGGSGETGTDRTAGAETAGGTAGAGSTDGSKTAKTGQGTGSGEAGSGPDTQGAAENASPGASAAEEISSEKTSPEDTSSGGIPSSKAGDTEPVSEGTGAGDADRLLPDGEKPDPSLRVGEDSDMPAWYPADPASFPFYHDADAPRVVDTADLFSDSEEAQMESRLAELRAQLGRDIVVFTDVSTYGLSHAVYAADFYDFNGYGIGDEREGVCLMICMDPEDRGWWCCCTGSVTRGLYTEEAANQIDDLLYEYMRSGNYGTGVLDWIENFRRLYTTGSPYNENWILETAESFSRFHDPDAPRVVDDAGILTGEQLQSLAQKAGSISEKYGVDVVIHTALHEGIADRTTFADRFFLTHGYGLGENYDGLQLTLFKRPNYKAYGCVTASGGASEKLSEVNRFRLEERCDSLLSDYEYYEAASQWLSQAEHMLRTGRAPRSAASWGFTTILELLAGLLFGSLSLGRAKAGMVTPKIKENADAYLVPGSLKIRNTKDTFLRSTLDRTYSPQEKEDRSSGSDSSGSSGHSSYKSSYSGSSGSSHSGSGRRF